jgi:hypothetical protein
MNDLMGIDKHFFIGVDLVMQSIARDMNLPPVMRPTILHYTVLKTFEMPEK